MLLGGRPVGLASTTTPVRAAGVPTTRGSEHPSPASRPRPVPSFSPFAGGWAQGGGTSQDFGASKGFRDTGDFRESGNFRASGTVLAAVSPSDGRGGSSSWAKSAPPGVRFRGTRSLASFHIINQELPPDMRMSQYLGTSFLGDMTLHPRMLEKLPPVDDRTAATEPASPPTLATRRGGGQVATLLGRAVSGPLHGSFRSLPAAVGSSMISRPPHQAGPSPGQACGGSPARPPSQGQLGSSPQPQRLRPRPPVALPPVGNQQPPRATAGVGRALHSVVFAGRRTPTAVRSLQPVPV